MLSDDQCWNVMQQRDSQYDGVFYVGVITTRIYCRPSCAARPLRKNVRFFATQADAVAAGLRPCKRCHPDSLSPEIRAIHIICRQLEANPEHHDLAALAAQVGYSPFHLTRLFKAHLGVSPKQYGSMIRRQRLRNQLTHTQRVAHAAYDTGFQSLGAMYADLPLGMSPTKHQRGGLGLELQYTTLDTRFGILVVVTSQRGVCFVGFTDDDDAATALVNSEYPHATVAYCDAHPLAEAVHAILNSQPNHHDIPVDIRATAFQQRVWQALRMIPRGHTLSYQQIADAIQQPRATRAVAQACAQNPLAVVVPCHRVIRSDGQIGGYRWNTIRKRDMLTYEQHCQSGES